MISWRSPLLHLGMALVVINAMAIFSRGDPMIAIRLAGLLVISWGINWLGSYLVGRSKPAIDMLISVLIANLIIDPAVSWQVLVAVLVGIGLAKFIFTHRFLPIFNPVVLGVILVGLLFPAELNVSWWGSAFSWDTVAVNNSIVLVYPLIAWIAWRFRRVAMLGAFLVSLIVGFLLTADYLAIEFILLANSTLLFMGGVMLIEPKTTPSAWRTQICWGLAAGMAYHLFNYWQIIESALWAIMLVNAGHYVVHCLLPMQYRYFLKK